MMSHWSKGAADAGYTGKVPGVQVKHDCIYFPKRFTTAGILAWAALYTTV